MTKKHKTFFGILLAAIAGILGHEVMKPPEQTTPSIDTVIVSKIIYGINGNLSNSPLNYSDAAFRQAITQLHPQIIRWPGGSVSNNFNPITGTADDGQGTPNKIEDVALLVKESHCEVMFVLNMVTHTLDENLQVLKKAQGLGIPVHYVELGNEYNNINSPGRVKYPTATDYANACKAWIEAISKEFPQTNFGAVGENKGYKGATNWNEDVLKVLSSYNVHLVLHEYPNPNYYVSNGKVNISKLDSVVNDDLHITGFDRQKDFWVTEYNVKNSDKQGATTDIDSAEWVNALKHLTTLLTNAGATVLCVHNITGKEGVFDVSKKGVTLLPTGEAFKELIYENGIADTIPPNSGVLTIGIMPYAIANTYGVNVSRQAAYAETFKTGSLHADTILLNINNSSLHRYTTDTTLFKAMVIKIATALKPAMVCIENEELLNGDIKVYCNELAAACHGLPWKCTNGGLTLPELSYWYWQQTKDSAFFKDNIPNNQKQGLLTGLKAQTIDNVSYEVAVLKGLQMPYVNVHYYFGYASQVQGLIRMFNYLKTYTGKEVISNEAGIYSAGLLSDVVSIAKATGMQWLILYSGTGTEGSGKALPISKDDFLNAIK